MDVIESKAGEDWVAAMRRVYTEDAATAEHLSGPDQNYALLRDCCVPIFALRILGKGRLRNVLDVGCGTGSLARVLAALAERVSGIDAVHEAIEIARQRAVGTGNIDFAVADIFSTPLAAETYDLIHVREFHPLTRDLYADDGEKRTAHRQIIAKLAATLAPGGHIYIAHMTAKRQCVKSADLAGVGGLEMICRGIDGRVLFLVAPVLGYRRLALTAARLLSLPLRLRRQSFFEIMVFRKP